MAKWLRAVLLLSPLAALALFLIVLGVGALLPSSYAVAESAAYRQSPAAVWAVVADLAALPTWDPLVHGIERLPDRDGHPVWRELTLTAHGRIDSPFFRFLLRFVYGSDRVLDIYLTALGRRLGETVQPVREGSP